MSVRATSTSIQYLSRATAFNYNAAYMFRTLFRTPRVALADENPATSVQSPANPTSADVLKLGVTDIPAPNSGEGLVLHIDASQQ